ncbi:hypothetical protein [Rhizobium metallidurans]|uniref:Uncharacterized protein n=1 Tax=Rhizobium metallidurans TaxID=1265931 RepID=A0A7W6CNA0_9HYPH|nr:hypothetical protein [Rhizobium metallidurans]MBB3963376.1 hypothetical protein [Rhizobium metallidurans]
MAPPAKPKQPRSNASSDSPASRPSAGFFRLAKNRKLSEERMKTLVREADLAEARFAIP